MKDLCIALAQSDTEAEIVQVLKDAGFWDNSKHWMYFAGLENSFSIIGNQQALPESALVEKIINSIDAVLMAECLKKGIDPTSKEAPQTIWDAVERFYNIRGGFLYNLDARERANLAEKIVNVISSGSKAVPSYSFIDFGEGQTAKTMPKTLLSLAGSNKLRIPFVQGKFNMGGTGVFLFCGDRNIQIMITKRHPEVAFFEKDDPTRNDWCFTIIRREDPREGQKHSVFTYLAPNGKIPQFKASALPLFPKTYPNPYGTDVEHCTFVKIIEYQIPRYKTNITLDMYNRLNCLLPRLALPVRLWERRKGFEAHTFETTLAGLSVRLEEDKREMLEFSSSSTFEIDGLKLPTTIYAFKNKEQANRYRSEEGIIFVQNGQTQGHLPKDFFKRKKVGMLNIADLLLVEVDCDGIDRRARERLFMNSRDRLRSGQLKKDIEDQLEVLINEHPGLREFREKRTREEIKDRLAKSKPLENVLEKIVKNNPILARLLGSGSRISSPFKSEVAMETNLFVGKRFPTFFQLKAGSSGEYIKEAYLKQRFRIQFNTDAENNYFKRDEDPGVLMVLRDGVPYGSGIVNLWKGTCTLSLELPDDVQLFDIYDLEVQVTDPTRIAPFINYFKVSIKGEAKQPGETKKGKRKEPIISGNGSEQKPPTLGIPEILEAYEKDWGEYDFDKESGLALRQGGDEDQYYFVVNVDNVYLQNEQKMRKDDALSLTEQFKYGLSLIGLALLTEEEKRKNHDNSEEEDKTKGIDNQIKEVTKAISPFIIPIIRELGAMIPEQ
ncbi:MAG: hypothetical protein NTU69_11800 [Proteobacteria bacterium]|nr:hypothetical protein [Pseudomonadota bacterium]